MKRICEIIVLFLLFMFPQIRLSGQSMLSVGSSVKDYTFRHLINYPSDTANIESFESKLLILDFWSEGCSGCILSWPKLLALQKEFRDNIQIILMNPWNSKTRVRSIFEKRGKMADINMNLPCTCGDSTLLQLFPITTTPLVIIIRNDTIRYIANGQILNSISIRAILEGSYVFSENDTFIDNTARIGIDPILPFFGEANVENDKHEGISMKDVICQSTLTRGKDSLWMEQYIRFNNDKGFVTCINSSIAELYRLAYSNRIDPITPEDEDMLMKSQVIWETKDSGIYQGSMDNSIQYQNLYNYQLISHSKTPQELRKSMKADLEKYFGLSVHWEKRKMECFVLSAEDTTLIAYKSGNWKRLMNTSMVNMNKVPIIYFIRGLEDMIPIYYDSRYPIIDETGLKGNLGSFSFEADFNNPDALDKALRKYKMHFTLQEREVNVLVIGDPPDHSPT